MTDDQIAELRRLLGEATLRELDPHCVRIDVAQEPGIPLYLPMSLKQAQAIVAAVNALPALLGALEAARAQNAKLRKALEPFATGCSMSRNFYNLCVDDAQRALSPPEPKP